MELNTLIGNVTNAIRAEVRKSPESFECFLENNQEFVSKLSDMLRDKWSPIGFLGMSDSREKLMKQEVDKLAKTLGFKP